LAEEMPNVLRFFSFKTGLYGGFNSLCSFSCVLEKYGFIENGVLYPSEQSIEETHYLMLKEYGGYSGYERGVGIFGTILAEARKAECLCRKAAVLLRGLATGRIYQDGNHRTAMATAETFLLMNGKKVWTEDSQEMYRFIKDILGYDVDEAAEWLECGPKETASDKSSKSGN